jgi:hypothetical protein
MALCPWQPGIYTGFDDHKGVGGGHGRVIGAGGLAMLGKQPEGILMRRTIGRANIAGAPALLAIVAGGAAAAQNGGAPPREERVFQPKIPVDVLVLKYSKPE